MESEPTETERATGAIREGLVNIAEVHKAIRDVIEASDATLTWRIDPNQIPVLSQAGIDQPFGPDDLTIGEQLAILDETGTGWDRFQPDTDQRHAKALLKTVLAHRSDHPDPDGAANTVTTGQFTDAYEIVEQRPPDPT